jgi:circadian clock protein KaiB
LAAPRSPLTLRLDVSGQALNSRAAIRNLESLQHVLAERAAVEVVDVGERPELAEEDRILATPTLVRRTPAPVRKIIGDLSDIDRVLVAPEVDGTAGATGVVDSGSRALGGGVSYDLAAE